MSTKKASTTPTAKPASQPLGDFPCGHHCNALENAHAGWLEDASRLAGYRLAVEAIAERQPQEDTDWNAFREGVLEALHTLTPMLHF